ncbi:cell wall hydrolase [uncultured Brevundimonas sp.]|uniref:cell wall hydrolase n=1 Tax=uncultured Brevundimonas sp. TaxID=213418 RepID=UPI0030EF20FA
MPHLPLKTVLTAASALALLASPLPALARQTPQAAPQPSPAAQEAYLQARGETYRRAPDSEQDPTELATTASLNAEIVARNDAAERRETAETAAHAEASARYREEAAAVATQRANYEASLKTAEAARVEYDRAYADWQATVRACEAGDRARCAAGSSSTQPW